MAAQALRSLGMDVDRLRTEVANNGVKMESPVDGHQPFTVEAKRAIEGSMRQAIQLGHNHIGTEHILLGLIAHSPGAVELLRSVGLQAGEVRRKVIELLVGGKAPSESDRPAIKVPPLTLVRSVGASEPARARIVAATVEEMTGVLTGLLDDDALPEHAQRAAQIYRRTLTGLIALEPVPAQLLAETMRTAERLVAEFGRSQDMLPLVQAEGFDQETAKALVGKIEAIEERLQGDDAGDPGSTWRAVITDLLMMARIGGQMLLNSAADSARTVGPLVRSLQEASTQLLDESGSALAGAIALLRRVGRRGLAALVTQAPALLKRLDPNGEE